MKQEIIILGAGESGTGAALLAAEKGYAVFVSEYGTISAERKSMLQNASIPFEEGGHTVERILRGSLIIKSPGISPDVAVVKAAVAAGIEIIDEIEFASRFTSAKIIAITGTNGKTTTTLLTYHLLKEAGLDVGLAGNVGHSLALQLIKGDREYFVVEMSSFQLDGITSFHPHISMVLNITPDHLDRYGYSFERYAKSKLSITQNQTADDYFIIHSDQFPVPQWSKGTNAQIREISLMEASGKTAWYHEGILHFADFQIPQKETALRGMHNAANMLCAIEAARLCGVGENALREGLKTFKNAPHRLEFVGEVKDVRFYNDSKATNVDAVKYALGSFEEPLVWIAGGIDKGNDYDLIMDEVMRKVRALICLGKDNTKLLDAFDGKIHPLKETEDIKQAVREGLRYAEKHDVVLLSPACASFDLFRNYEDRGNQFREAVQELKRELENNLQKR